MTLLTEQKISLTRQLSEYAAGLRYEDIPQDVLTIARHGVLDWVGCVKSGVSEEVSKLIKSQIEAEGGYGRSTLLGSRDKVSAVQAALFNGVASHALDYDDKHFAIPGHPTSPVLGAVFALAELEERSGRDLLTGYIVGLEVGCRVGLLLDPDHYNQGWHATGTVGTLGAACAAANILGLDDAQTEMAIGLAVTQASGLKSMFGTMAKSLNVGKANANGVYAAQLAARGFTAASDALLASQGMAEAMGGDVHSDKALDGLGDSFHTRQLLFKYHASCYATHALIEACLKIRHDKKISLQDIRSIKIYVPSIALKMCDISHPENATEAKFSLRQVCAMALEGYDTGDVNVYSKATCRDETLTEYRTRSAVMSRDDLPPGTGEVVIDTADGTIVQFADMRVPEQDHVYQEAKLSQKFKMLNGSTMSEENMEAVIAQVLKLDEQEDICPLIELLT